MKLWILSLIMSSFAGMAACQSLPPEIDDGDRVQLQAASVGIVAAYNQTELEQFASVFTSDAIIMPPNGPAVNGRDAIMAWKEGHRPGLRLASRVDHIGGSGDTAYMRGQFCLFQLKEDGSFSVNPGKFLETLKLQDDGQWLVDVQIFNSDLDEDAPRLDACPFADGWE